MSDDGSRTATVLSAQHVLEYPYTRSLGAIVGAFFAGLKERRIHGVKTPAGRVLVPPLEYDPETGASLADLVEVASSGVVTSWAWVAAPRPVHPMQEPFAWALIRLDGADTAMVHAVGVSGPDAMRTGMRVRARWRTEREGRMTDIECFEPEDA